MTVEISTVDVVVSADISHVDILVDVVVNPNVGSGGGGEMTDQQIADKLDTFTVAAPTDADYIILGGKKKTLISDLKSLFKTANDLLYAAIGHTHVYSTLSGLPTLFSGAYADLTGKPTLFSGSYTDLSDKPTIPTIDPNTVVDANYAADKIRLADTEGPNTGDQDIDGELGIDRVNGELESYLNKHGDWVKIQKGGGLGSDVYLTNTPDVLIAGYKQMSYDVPVAETEISAVVNNNEVLMGAFLYPLGLSTDTISGGAWDSQLWAKVSSVAQESKIRVVNYLRHINGTETIIGSSLTESIESTTYVELTTTISYPTVFVLPTDRLGIKVYATTTRTTNTTVSTILGDGRGFHVFNPLKLRHDELRDKNSNPLFLHLTQTEKTAFENKLLYNGEFAEAIHKLAATPASQTITLAKSTITTIIDSDNSFAVGNVVGDLNRVIVLALAATDTTASNQYVVFLKIGTGAMPTVTLPAIDEFIGGSLIFSTGTTFEIIFTRIKTATGVYKTSMRWGKTQ